MERSKGISIAQAFLGPRLLPRDQSRKMAGAARAAGMVDIRDPLPAATTWLTKDLRPWPPSSPERLTTHILVPITAA